MPTRVVYVQLLDEGVDVWRPVEAEDLGADRYRLIEPSDYDATSESWEFAPGTVVRCELRRLEDGTFPVAVGAES